jgi:hypothetical protein
MPRPLDNTIDVVASSSRRSSGVPVPQEHIAVPDANSTPRDWSQLGRRVAAEAWRRTTEELAARHTRSATPVVPASVPEGQP